MKKCKGKITKRRDEPLDSSGPYLFNMIRFWGARGYETIAEYNEYGYPVFKHEVCMDSLRDAGTYDITTRYEYVYYSFNDN